MSSIIERYNRTQNDRIKVIFKVNKNYKWIDNLEEIVKDYNNSRHRTIGTKPIKVTKDIEKDLLETVFKNTLTDFVS